MRRMLSAVLLATLVGPGCTEVPFHQKEALGRRIMQMDEDELELAFRNKIQASREVSGGRPGQAAGGGCGCGN